MQTQSAPPRPLRWSLDETARQLQVSRKTVNRRIASGDIDTVTDGRRRYVLDRELQRYAEGLPKNAAA